MAQLPSSCSSLESHARFDELVATVQFIDAGLIDWLDTMAAAYRIEILREVERELLARCPLEKSLIVFKRGALEPPEQLVALSGPLALLN